MTRIVGDLWGSNGPLNGRLYVKPSAMFIGAPKQINFWVENGKVDIELPPAPSSFAWLVGWKEKFEVGEVVYSERWVVPKAEEVALDDIRGFRKERNGAQGKTRAVDVAVWKAEAEEAKAEAAKLKQENAGLFNRVNAAEAKASANAGTVASLVADNSKLRKKLAEASLPQVQVEEKIVEKQVMPQEAKAALAMVRSELVILQKENEELKKQAEQSVSFSTHFSNMQHEIDRLRNENQHLLSRIEELKQPRRSVSSLRQEMIANLDKLIEG